MRTGSSDLFSDVRGAWRQLGARPLFAVLVVSTLGLTIGAAQAEMDAPAHARALEHPGTNHDTRVRVQLLREAVAEQLRPYVMGVAGAVTLLLLLGCVNLGGLFVARSAARVRDMAARAARRRRAMLTRYCPW